MNPILLQIGPLHIRWYGAMIAMASIVGWWLAGLEAERKGIGKQKIDDLFIWTMIGSLIGARLYYVAFSGLPVFQKNFFSIFAFWQGGLAIHGGILGGLLVCFIYAHRHKIPFLKLTDTLAPSLILGQAIGRIGCFFNGDAFGTPTNLPWGLVYSPESPAGQMYPDQPLHPTQLYEMIFNLIIFTVLWKLRKSVKVDGYLTSLYVILYSFIRIFVEYFRADKLTYLGNISAAQSIGVIGIILSVVLLFTLKKKKDRI